MGVARGGALAFLVLAMPLAPRPPEERYRAVDNPFDLRPFDGALLLAEPGPARRDRAGRPGRGRVAGGAVRRARGVERLQLRWVVLAAALTGVGMLASVVLVAAGNEEPSWLGVGGLCGVAAAGGWRCGAALPPVRPGPHHQPHATYGLLTVLLGLGYAGVVPGRLLPQGSSLVVAAATLVVAAVFQPARRRIQAAMDRRFNRRRHDAARTIAAFNTRLRDEVDLEALTGELLAVVEETMQPTQTSPAAAATVGRISCGHHGPATHLTTQPASTNRLAPGLVDLRPRSCHTT